jgi:LysM repeat protein
MNSFKILFPSAIALALASCASNKSDGYDTNNPYGPADASTDSAPYQSVAPTNQTYDTPAAYEDAGSTTAASSPNIPATPAASSPTPSYDAAPATGGGGVATVHTVVKGDTLSGIAKKYKVSIASIKAANNMTKDIVVLGAKLKIPAN